MNPHDWSEAPPATPRLISARPAVVTALSSVLTRAASPSPSGPTTTTTITPFHALDPPQISIAAYVRRIAKYAYCSNAALLSALLYMERAAAANPALIPSPLSTHRLFLASVVLSAKFHDDTSYNLEYYGKVGGLPVSELATLEHALLRAIDYRLAVAPGAFASLETRALALATQVPSALSTEAVAAATAAALPPPKSVGAVTPSPLFAVAAQMPAHTKPHHQPAARLSRCASYLSCASPSETPAASPSPAATSTPSTTATPWDSPVSNPDTSSSSIAVALTASVAPTASVPSSASAPPTYPVRVPPHHHHHHHYSHAHAHGHAHQLPHMQSSFSSSSSSALAVPTAPSQNCAPLVHAHPYPQHAYPGPLVHPPPGSSHAEHAAHAVLTQAAAFRRASDSAGVYPPYAQNPRHPRMRMW